MFGIPVPSILMYWNKQSIRYYKNQSISVAPGKKSHSEKRFDWIKENDLFERLSLIQRNDLFKWNKICLIQRNDLFKWNKICLIQTKYLWTK